MGFNLFLSNTRWQLMEPGGLNPHLQGLSNNPYPKPYQPSFYYLSPISLRSILIMSTRLRLGLPEDIFPVGLRFKMLKALLSTSILTTSILVL